MSQFNPSHQQRLYHVPYFPSIPQQGQPPPGQPLNNLDVGMSKMHTVHPSTTAYIAGTVIPPPSHHGIPGHPHSGAIPAQHLYVKEGGGYSSMPTVSQPYHLGIYEQPPPTPQGVTSQHPSVGPQRAMFPSKGTYMYVNAAPASAPVATSTAVQAPPYMMSAHALPNTAPDTGAAPSNPHSIGATPPSHVLMSSHPTHYTVQAHSTPPMNNITLSEGINTKFTSSVPSSSRVPTPPAPSTPTTCSDSGQQKCLTPKNKFFSVPTSISNQNSIAYAKSPCLPVQSATINGESDNLRNSSPHLTSNAVRIPISPHPSNFKAPSPNSNGCSSPSIPGPNGLRYQNNVTCQQGPPLPVNSQSQSANTSSDTFAIASPLACASNAGDVLNGSCTTSSPSSGTCNKMNVNKLEGTISDVLNLALSSDPHEDVFALHERKFPHATEQNEFKVPNHVDPLQHTSVSTPSALSSVTTSAASSPRPEKRSGSSNVLETVQVHATAAPVANLPSTVATVSTTPLQINTTVALSPCSIGTTSFTWNRGTTPSPLGMTSSPRSVPVEPQMSESGHHPPSKFSPSSTTVTKKRKPGNRTSSQGDNNKKLKLTTTHPSGGASIAMKIQQHPFQPHRGIHEDNVTPMAVISVNGTGNNSYNSPHFNLTQETSFPQGGTASQQQEQQCKAKFETLRQFTSSYFTKQNQSTKPEVPVSMMNQQSSGAASFRVSRAFTLPVLVQLRPLASLLRTKTMAFRQEALVLERRREVCMGKYQMQTYQPVISNPGTEEEVDKFLIHNRLLASGDVPKADTLFHCSMTDSSKPECENSLYNEVPSTPLAADLEEKLEILFSQFTHSPPAWDEKSYPESKFCDLNGRLNPRRPATPPLSLKHIPSPRTYFHLDSSFSLNKPNVSSKGVKKTCTSDATVRESCASASSSMLVQDTELASMEEPFSLEDLKRPPVLKCGYCSQQMEESSPRAFHSTYSALSGEASGTVPLTTPSISFHSHNPERVSFCSRPCYHHFKSWFRLWKYNVPDARITPSSRNILPSVLLQGSLKLRAKIPPPIQVLVPPKEDEEEDPSPKKLLCKRVFHGEEIESPTVKARRRELDTLHQLSLSECSLKLPIGSEIVDKRECILCRRCSQEESWGRLIPFGLSPRWVHQYCAAWSLSSPRLSSLSNPNEFTHVPEWSLQDALKGVCDVCGKTGAGRECELCAQRYHLPCACEEGREITLDVEGKFYCPEHYYIPVAECQRSSLKDTIYRNVPRTIVPADRVSPFAEILRQGGCAGGGGMNYRLGGLLVESVGHISPHSIYTGRFHTLRHIYPLGYRARRYFWSCVHPMKRAVYLCEIDAVYSQDGDHEELEPLFRVTMVEDGEDVKPRIFTNTSCDALWQQILRSIHSLQNKHSLYRLHPHRTHGEVLFGLEEQVVVHAIESLPGALSLNTHYFTQPRASLLQDLPVYSDERGASRVRPYPGSQFLRREAYTFPIEAQLGPVHFEGALSLPCLPVTMVEPSEQDCSLLMKQRKQNLQERLLTLRREEWETHVYIAPSRVQGFGVFAAKEFDVGHFVIRYVGECIRLAVARQRLVHYRRHRRCAYFLRLGADLLLDSTVSGGAGRYVQHSCQPNCRLEVFETHSGKHVVFVAKRRIIRTEELTCDYASFLQPSNLHGHASPASTSFS